MGKKSDQSVEHPVGEYSLRDRLAGMSRRRKTVTIYTDAETGAELGYARDEVLPGGIKTGGRIRSGLVGEMDELEARGEAILQRLDAEKDAELQSSDALLAESAEISEKAKEFGPRIKDLREKLEETAMVFTLQALPEIVVRGVRRRARLALDIKGKGIPDDKDEDYRLEYVAILLSESVAGWEDRLAGEHFPSLSIEQARDLRDHLPIGQFDRLDYAIGELSFKAAIDNTLTDSADF